MLWCVRFETRVNTVEIVKQSVICNKTKGNLKRDDVDLLHCRDCNQTPTEDDLNFVEKRHVMVRLGGSCAVCDRSEVPVAPFDTIRVLSILLVRGDTERWVYGITEPHTEHTHT